MDEFLNTKEFVEDKGKKLGRYRITRKIGEGAMGAVYQAHDTSLERVVAIKVLSKRAAADANAVQRFIREAKTTARLHHPNIVPMHEFEQISGAYCLVMDFIDGLSLDQLLEQERPSFARMGEIMIGILSGLQYAHEQEIIHRDIKPSNILIDKTGRPFITDFGLAKAFTPDSDLRISRTGEMLGTLAYMAPEQAQDTKHATDARSDIYSAGAVLYKMLTGKLPFDVENPFAMMYKLTHTKTQSPRKIDPEIPVAIERVCLKALEKEKSDRYQTAAEMARDISAYLAEEGIHHPRPAVNQQSKQLALWLAKQNPIHLAIWGILVLLGFISSLLILQKSSPVTEPKLQPLATTPNNTNNLPLPLPTTATKIALKIVPMYDPLPPSDYPKLPVIFRSDRGVQSIALDDSIEPGVYQLSAILPGYECLEHGKMITVRPGHLFHLTLTLNALPREVNAKILNVQNGTLVTPTLFSIDKKPAIGNRFRPGSHRLYAFFENYQELDIVAHIPVGEATFQYQTVLTPLQELSLPLRDVLAELSHIRKPDGTSYDLEVYVDEKKLQAAHFKYQFQGAEIYSARLLVPPEAKEILLRCGFFYTKLPIKQINSFTRLDKIEVNALIAHLEQIKERDLFLKELELILGKDKDKLAQLSPFAQTAFYNFLVANTAAADNRDMTLGIWTMRRLVNKTEADSYEVFNLVATEADKLSFNDQSTIWQKYLQKYPQTIYQEHAAANLEYARAVAKYEEVFQESLRNCHLSTSEKRALQRMETLLKPEDIAQVRKKMAEYLKKLECGQNLEEMLK